MMCPLIRIDTNQGIYGLGVTLHEELVKRHLAEPGYFEPTPQWNVDRTNGRTWS